MLRLRYCLLWLLAAALASGCGQDTSLQAKAPTSAVHATVTGGAELSLELPAQSVRLVLELRSGLQAKALPAASSVVVTLTGGQLTSPFVQTITASQFIAGTAQIILSGLNAGNYHIATTVRNAAEETLVSGGMDVSVTAGQSTSARLVLIYGDAATPGGLAGVIDAQGPDLAITSLALDNDWATGVDTPVAVTVTTSRDALGGLTYAYTATGGTFQGSGPQVVWQPPPGQGGSYTLTVTVADGIHEPVSQSATATVNAGAFLGTPSISFENFA